MSNLYILLRETPPQGPITTSIDDLDYFLNGEPAKPPASLPRYVLKVEPGTSNPTDFPPCDIHDASGGQLLMSSKLVDLLTSAGIRNIEYFDCEVIYEPLQEKFPYQLANIVGAMKAVDLKGSECTVDEEGFVENIHKLKLTDTHSNGLDIFRLYEALPMLIISERLKHLLENAHITGIRIIEDSEWQPGLL